MGESVEILRVVVASPSDVPEERNHVEKVVDELNHSIARDKGLRLEVARWETDAYPGFHPEGPQGLIDPHLRIDQSDILIGIFWKRFGTPTHDAQSGTEHEFRTAYNAWRERGQPQIMVYFCQKPHTPQSRTETDQWGQVLDFREQFPREGLWWPYQGERDFEGLVRQHLTRFLLQRHQPLQPPDPNGAPPPQAHRATVIDEVTTRLKELSEERLKGIAQAMLDLAKGKDTGVSLISNRETLAAQTAVCMVDHLAAADVVSTLAGRLRGMGRQDASRVADVIDYLLPLNYVPDIVQRLSAQIETAGFGLVENEVVTWTLAEIILAGFDRKPALFKVLSDGSVRGQAALDYDVGPVPGPGDMPGQTSGQRYAVRDVLLHLLALLEATPQRQGGVDIESEIRDYAGRLRESLKAERAFNGERCTYFVMKLPEERHKRAFHKEVLAEVGTCVPQLFFVELAPYQTRPGEAEMDHYIRRIVRSVREHDERVS